MRIIKSKTTSSLRNRKGAAELTINDIGKIVMVVAIIVLGIVVTVKFVNSGKAASDSVTTKSDGLKTVTDGIN